MSGSQHCAFNQPWIFVGAVVVRFHEDGSRYWFPVSEVEGFLQDMQEHGSDNFAAEVLAGALAAQRKASGAPSSSATAGQFQSCTAGKTARKSAL